MTRYPRSLPRLTGLCQVLSDAALAKLTHAIHQKAQTQAFLDELSKIPPASDLGLVPATQTELLYQSWASSRRASLNVRLAEQTVAVSQAKTAASLALGRLESLSKLMNRRGALKDQA